jgi:hypothetical protein
MDNKIEKSNPRRNFLAGAVTLTAGFGLSMVPSGVNGEDRENHNKNLMNTPFEDSLPVYNISRFGAVGNGSFLNTFIIQSVINECSGKGGGVVFFPPGDFLTGSIQIRDNVNIYLSAGCIVWGSTLRKDYDEHAANLFYAIDAKNIAISGEGTIDANGPAFWKRENGKWITGEWRPNRVLSFIRCENILLQTFTIRNSSSWTIQPVDCIRMNITGISIINGIYDEDGPNTDGIDTDGCSILRISNCYLQCGDDAIVLKITDRPGGNKICRDITVTNCIIQSSETALKIGSESYGEFKNIIFSNCAIHDSGCGFGLWMRDGGIIDGMVVSNISMDTTKIKNGGQPIYIWSHRRTDQTNWGTIKNVTISNMTVTGQGGIFISGAKEKYIEGLTLENIKIIVQEGRDTTFNENPPDPFTAWGHHRAPFDIFCRYVDNLTLRNVQLTWSQPEKIEWGSAIRCWHVRNLEIAGFTGRQSLLSSSPVCWLKNVNGAFIYNCRATEGANTFLKIEDGTQWVTLMNNELSQAKRLYESDSGMDAKEIFESGNRLPATWEQNK